MYVAGTVAHQPLKNVFPVRRSVLKPKITAAQTLAVMSCLDFGDGYQKIREGTKSGTRGAALVSLATCSVFVQPKNKLCNQKLQAFSHVGLSNQRCEDSKINKKNKKTKRQTLKYCICSHLVLAWADLSSKTSTAWLHGSQ